DQEQKIQEQEIQEQEQKTQEQEQKTQEQEQKTGAGAEEGAGAEDPGAGGAGARSRSRRPRSRSRTNSHRSRRTSGSHLLTRLTLDSNFSSWQFVRDDDGCKQQIGSGGFGKVYKALTDKNQTVAVKIIKLAGAMTSKKLNKAVEKECAEIAVLRKLEHPNILKFLKYERTKQGKLCIFTELISGNSLSGLMQQQQKPFAEKAVRDFSQQICTALNFLHTRKPTILHRDIKGSNIMLTHKGRIKLIDFGLVKEITNTITDSTPHLCGTVFFMACELFTDTGKLMYSPKTDVWAFGCTVYELLTG
uniref:Protein kinase domain-containing protein n=1 Tax=Macrostomum lignano TaxID=282301 RepID=A0A1I8HRG8_9PLAT